MTTIRRQTLAGYLDELLQPHLFHDYAPNGLQIEGRADIRRIVTGVSANQALIDAAIDHDADALLVHHGFFWKNEARTLTGIRARRVGKLLGADVSLFAYHLPLDAHPELGNNAGLLNAIGFPHCATFDADGPVAGGIGESEQSAAREDVVERIADACGREPLTFLHGASEIRRVGVCTGGGASFFEAAIEAGVDLFITGEPAEMSAGLAREHGANFVAAGHHATERFGPRLLGEHLAERFGVAVSFIDVDNPV